MDQVAFVGVMEEAILTQDLIKKSRGYSASYMFFFRTQRKRPPYFISVAVMNSTLSTQFLPLFFDYFSPDSMILWACPFTGCEITP